MAKILVTGACGLLGSSQVPTLAWAGHEVLRRTVDFFSHHA